MKKNITRFILIACAFVFSIALVLSWALFWPMPKLALPVKYRYVFIKSINIVDVVSGKTLDKRDILIRGNTISKIDTSGNLKIPLKAFISLALFGKSKTNQSRNSEFPL